jgi:hypothetical protein
MVEKLLTLEALLAGATGLILLCCPQISARLLGWPSASGFWPRIAGALLTGLAAGTAVDLAGWTQVGSRAGVGLVGHIATNIILAFVLVSLMMVGDRPASRRGRVFGWIAAALLTVLALVEIAHL